MSSPQSTLAPNVSTLPKEQMAQDQTTESTPSTLDTLVNYLLDFKGTIADPLCFYGTESDKPKTIVAKVIAQHLRHLAPEPMREDTASVEAVLAIMLCAERSVDARTLELTDTGSSPGCDQWRHFYMEYFITGLERAVHQGVNRKL